MISGETSIGEMMELAGKGNINPNFINLSIAGKYQENMATQHSKSKKQER